MIVKAHDQGCKIKSEATRPARFVGRKYLETPLKIVVDISFVVVFFYFSEKTSIDISCEQSNRKTIHI